MEHFLAEINHSLPATPCGRDDCLTKEWGAKCLGRALPPCRAADQEDRRASTEPRTAPACSLDSTQGSCDGGWTCVTSEPSLDSALWPQVTGPPPSTSERPSSGPL